MNTRKIKFLRRKSWFGKLLRLPFKLIPATQVVSILRGPLKNMKWIKGSHNVSILLGTYESKQTRMFKKVASNLPVFWDLGAHVGYYSLLFHAANPKGKIFAFEPLEETADTFKKHMELNKVSSVKVFPAAVSDADGSFRFNKTSTSVAGKLDESGETMVKVLKLSRLVDEKIVELPDIIKMDIEGAELLVLKDLRKILVEKKPLLFLSTHGKQVHLDCLAFLAEIGYQLKPLDSDDVQTSRELFASR